MKSHKCCFLVMGFNNHEITEKSISLLSKYFRNTDHYSIKLFDNASEPSLEPLAQKFSLDYERSSINLGFAKGYNEAISPKLLEEYAVICLVNNDVFIDQDFAKKIDEVLTEFLDTNELGLLQPQLYKDENKKIVENFGLRLFSSGLSFQNDMLVNTSTLLANAACLFIKTELIRKLESIYGYVFVPLFEMYGEDLELSIRIKRMGYQIKVSDQLFAQHLGSTSLGRKNKKALFFAWRNVLWTSLIHRRRIHLIRTLPHILLGQTILFFLSISYGYPLLLPRIYLDTMRKWNQIDTIKKSLSYPYLENLYITNGIFPNKIVNL